MIQAKSGSTLVVRLQDGEGLPEGLTRLELGAAGVLSGIGMLRDVVLGYWDGTRYVEQPIAEPVELLSLQGNLGVYDGKPVLHAHVIVGHEDLSTQGGHLLSATVHNTAELFMALLPDVALERRMEPSGLPGLHPRNV